MSNFLYINLITFLSIIGIALLLFFYVFTLYQCLNLISQESRAIKPWTVWLIFVPLFGILWTFYVVTKIAKSLHTESRKRNLQINKIDQGQILGFAYAGFNLMSFIFPSGQRLTVLVISSMFWIAYWVVLWQQIKILKKSSPQVQA